MFLHLFLTVLLINGNDATKKRKSNLAAMQALDVEELSQQLRDPAPVLEKNRKTEADQLDQFKHVNSITCCVYANCTDYRGTLFHTRNGKKCQAWDDNTYHKHDKFTPKKQPNAGLIHNYCRNPSKWIGGAWCYTVDSNARWEYCDIPRCPERVLPFRKDLKCDNTEYGCDPNSENPCCSGPLPLGRCGKTDAHCSCKHCIDYRKWNKDTIPKPASENIFTCCMYANCTDYRGGLSITRSGKKCQAWNDNTYHQHDNITPERYPNADLTLNYCRNPTRWIVGSWCYTEDSNKRWEECDVPKCSTQKIPDPVLPIKQNGKCDNMKYGCNPAGDKPCCSNWKLENCGNTEAHCSCENCVDYRKIHGQNKRAIRN